MRGLKIQAGTGSQLYPSGSSVTNGVDPDAQAFITAAGITDPTQQGAIDDLVIGLKADSLWTKMQAIYPFVGGTATTHKYNLKDPRDLDAAFRITWSGGVTHSSNGVLSNGGDGYGTTNYTPSTHGTDNSTHLSFYSRTNTSSGGVAIGCGVIDSTSAVIISPSGYAGPSNTYVEVYETPAGAVNAAVADTLGLFIASRTAAAVLKAFKNSAQLGSTSTTTSNGIAGATSGVFVLARGNAGTPVNLSLCQGAWASIGIGLTDADAANLYTSVQAFQTTLGRQV